jgi:hypothetical protein
MIQVRLLHSKGGKPFSRETSVIQAENGRRFMKNYSTTLLAFIFILFSLVSLLFAARNPDTTTVVRIELPQRISDIGPRFALASH